MPYITTRAHLRWHTHLPNYLRRNHDSESWPVTHDPNLTTKMTRTRTLRFRLRWCSLHHHSGSPIPFTMTDSPTFVLKTLAAEECRLTLSPDLHTLGDLRRFIHIRWQIPSHMQRLITNGRQIGTELDSSPLDSLIRRFSTPEQDSYVWLMWMTDHDYLAVERGGMFLASELDNKRHLYGTTQRPFEYVTLRTWRTLNARAVLQFEEFSAAQAPTPRRDRTESPSSARDESLRSSSQ